MLMLCSYINSTVYSQKLKVQCTSYGKTESQLFEKINIITDWKKFWLDSMQFNDNIINVNISLIQLQYFSWFIYSCLINLIIEITKIMC